MAQLHALNDDGGRAAAAIADGRSAQRCIVLVQDVDEGGHDARTGHADGVSQRHRAAVDVHTVRVQAKQLRSAFKSAATQRGKERQKEQKR